MKDQRMLDLGISLLEDIVIIYTLIIAIILYFKQETTYFYFVMVLFSIRKIYSITQIIKNIRIPKFFVFELLQIQSVYIYFNQYFVMDDLFYAAFVRIIWIIFNILVQFSFFICKIISDIEVRYEMDIYFYLNFIFLILLLVASLSWVKIIENSYQDNKNKCYEIFTYYFTISSLTFFYDSNGTNIGIYQPILIGLNAIQLIVLKFFNWSNLKFQRLYSIFSFSILFNFDFSRQVFVPKGYESLESIQQSIFSYLNQIIRISLLIAYSFDNTGGFNNLQQSKLIKIIFVLVSMLLSLIYFSINFKPLILYLFRLKVLQINSLKDFQLVSFQLNQKSNLMKIYKIFILLPETNDCLTQPMMESDVLQNQLLLFWGSVSFQLKQNKIVDIMYNYTIYQEMIANDNCLNSIYIDAIISDIEIIHTKLKNNLRRRINDLQYTDNLILNRLFNGFIQTGFTNYLFKKNKIKNKKTIQKAITDILKFNVYFKQISNFMINNPMNVLYDLYDN